MAVGKGRRGARGLRARWVTVLRLVALGELRVVSVEGISGAGGEVCRRVELEPAGGAVGGGRVVLTGFQAWRFFRQWGAFGSVGVKGH